MTSCAERFGVERLATDTLGQGPCSRKVPFAFASSTAIVESDTTIAAHMIEGLLMASFPAGQPSPNRNLRPLADADLTANETDSQFLPARRYLIYSESLPTALTGLKSTVLLPR